MMLFQVEKEIGEKRMISFHGTGLSVAPEMSFSDITASCESPEEVSSIHLPVDVHCSCYYASCTLHYVARKTLRHLCEDKHAFRSMSFQLFVSDVFK